jgi:hypothetical protein
MENDISTVKMAAIINIVLGLWFLVSTWVFHIQMLPNAWNNWIAGFLVVLFGAVRLMDPLTGESFSFLNLLIGAWIFGSPWIYDYAGNSARAMNSLCVGALVFTCATIAFIAIRTRSFPSGRP